MIHRHILKLNARFAGEVVRGRKRFEVRFNDRCFQRGDEVKFTVVDNDGDPIVENIPIYEELEMMTFKISFVVSGYGLKEGYVAFGLEEIEDN